MNNRTTLCFAFFKFTVFSLIFYIGASLFVSSALAADAPVFDNLLSKFQDSAQQWEAIMLSAAETIFWLLASISLTWRLIQRTVEGVDIPSLFRELFWPVFFTGFYYFLLQNGANIAAAILSTFMQLAERGSAITGVSTLAFSPSGIMALGDEIWWEVLRTSGKGLIYSMIPTSDAGLLANLLGVFVSFGIWLLMALIAIDVLILLIAAWVLLYGGLFVLAFGGGFAFGFHSYAVNYFRSIIALGFQLLGTGLIVTVGTSIMQTELISFRQGFDLSTIMGFLLVAIAMKMVVSSIPPMLSGMINGNVGSLGPKGEGIVGGILGAGGAAAATAVSMGLGSVAAHNLKAAQSSLASVKAAASAKRAVSPSANLNVPNTLGGTSSSEASSEGQSAWMKGMGIQPEGFVPAENAPESNATSTETATVAEPSTNVDSNGVSGIDVPGVHGQPAVSVPGTQATSSAGSTTSASASGVSSAAIQSGATSATSTSTPSSNGLQMGTFESSGLTESQGALNDINGEKHSSSLDQMSLSQLTDMQQELEDRIRALTTKRDMHYASAKASMLSGSKTLFNYMAFFNSRGYF